VSAPGIRGTESRKVTFRNGKTESTREIERSRETVWTRVIMRTSVIVPTLSGHQQVRRIMDLFKNKWTVGGNIDRHRDRINWVIQAAQKVNM
jgi:hypothetical protein